jgi:hypothetical protein
MNDKPTFERDLNRELDFHLEQQIRDYIAGGMTQEEAERKARIQFGGLDRVKEACREARWSTLFETSAQDLRLR